MKYRGQFFNSINPLKKIREEMRQIKAATSELTKLTSKLLTEEMNSTEHLIALTKKVEKLTKKQIAQADYITVQQELIMDLTVKVHELEKKAEQNEEYAREQSESK